MVFCRKASVALGLFNSLRRFAVFKSFHQRLGSERKVNRAVTAPRLPSYYVMSLDSVSGGYFFLRSALGVDQSQSAGGV